jgi:NAD(P)H-dependent flavin oxidoreductase YrpB (nitropropane dioxygenase family)
MKNKLPDLIIGNLRINPPIFQGGMGVRVSGSSLVSAVSNEGAFGVIAAVGLGEEWPDKNVDYKTRSELALREMIRQTKRLTRNPFGVNIMYALTNYDELVKVAVEEEVGAIISGAGLPLHLPSLTRDSSIKLIPIVSSARAADLIMHTWLKRYQRLPDAFVIEGPLAGGHLGFNYTEAIGIKQLFLEDIVKDVLGLVKGYEVTYNKKIPVIAAGGIFTGKDIAHMLNLGASGVQMATRFVCTKECDISNKYKETYLKCKEEDIVVILSPAGMPARVIKNRFVERIQAGEKMKFDCPYLCLKTCDPYSANYCIAQVLVNAYRGDIDNGFAMCGANAYRVKKIVSVKELINELIEESTVELQRI